MMLKKNLDTCQIRTHVVAVRKKTDRATVHEKEPNMNDTHRQKMRIALFIMSVLMCSCYQATPFDNESQREDSGTYDQIDTDTEIGLDCEQACDVEMQCNDFFDELGAYVECLEYCDYINEQTIEAGELDDAECVDACYSSFESGDIECTDLPVCITGDCKPWWAQG
jgi:hypothetical protein